METELQFPGAHATCHSYRSPAEPGAGAIQFDRGLFRRRDLLRHPTVEELRLQKKLSFKRGSSGSRASSPPVSESGSAAAALAAVEDLPWIMPPIITVSTSLTEWQTRMNMSLADMAQSIEAVTRVVRDMPGIDLPVFASRSPTSPGPSSSLSPVLDISAANRPKNKHLSSQSTFSIASTVLEEPTSIAVVADTDGDTEPDTPKAGRSKHMSALSTTSTVIDGPSLGSPIGEASMPPNAASDVSFSRTMLNKLEHVERAQAELRAQLKEMEIRLQSAGASALPGAVMERLEKLEKKVEEQELAMNLDQLRLPARLHNATCLNYPQPIVAPAISPGKVPKNFPSTKGEFEHLTKERYEQIMDEYKIKYTGDTDAKRETLRTFLGLPPRDSNSRGRK